jgi:hypothetical protein
MTIEAKLDRIIELLEANIAPKAPYADPPQAAAPKKVRAAKPASPAVADSTSGTTTTVVAPVPPTAPAAPPSSTLDDVRVALVTLSSKTGSRAKSDEILAKHNARVTGDLKPEQYAQVVAACQSAG